jgi:hypothetical protein
MAIGSTENLPGSTTSDEDARPRVVTTRPRVWWSTLGGTLKLLRGRLGIGGLAMLAGFALSSNAAPLTFETEYPRLLTSYASYKGYGKNLPVAEIEKRLTGDRLNTVKGLVRASLVDLNPGGPLSGWIDEIRGIWGVRTGSTEGRYQFRLSVYMKPGIRKALDSANAFNGAAGPHVLLPEKTGGDDDPAFTKFRPGRNPKTWRQETDNAARLQISLLRDDERTGEIDVDFHGFFDSCHTVPANSDIGSSKPSNHSHLRLLNAAFPFAPDLTSACQNTASHCMDTYKSPYCR